MGLQTLIEKYPEQFARYAEKVLDSYFGNIFVTWRNERILYVNARMAASVRMTKEELTGMTLEQLREKKLWLRSVSREMYDGKKSPFNAYNVSKYGDELFTHIEPICDEKGEVIMSAQFSIPKRMLAEFSDYITQEKSSFRNYKDIADYLEARKEASEVIISNSPAARLAFDDARYLSSMDSTVLLCGETGTGKDVLANYIYHNSKRASQPFVPVNCSAIPAELVESEFFGYERGAFTGARSSGKPGLFEMADHGTLFLDEVGELPPAMQAKLLRVRYPHRQDGRAPDRGHQPGSAAYGGGGTLPGGSVLPPQRHAAVPAAPAGAAGRYPAAGRAVFGQKQPEIRAQPRPDPGDAPGPACLRLAGQYPGAAQCDRALCDLRPDGYPEPRRGGARCAGRGRAGAGNGGRDAAPRGLRPVRAGLYPKGAGRMRGIGVQSRPAFGHPPLSAL